MRALGEHHQARYNEIVMSSFACRVSAIVVDRGLSRHMYEDVLTGENVLDARRVRIGDCANLAAPSHLVSGAAINYVIVRMLPTEYAFKTSIAHGHGL